MSQDAMSDDSSPVFTFRPWRPETESWDAFIDDLETAYAQYLSGYQQGNEVDPAAHERDPDEPAITLAHPSVTVTVGASPATTPGSIGIHPNPTDCIHQWLFSHCHNLTVSFVASSPAPHSFRDAGCRSWVTVGGIRVHL